ncbi:MAG: hypothetical protein PHP62_06080 [Candidatus Moranbacteria bacterium]|nr:hypothetical protein [Candidatus Moranbacteria bacterium]
MKDGRSKAITIKKVPDASMENTLIQEGGYDFVVSERMNLLYVSTRHNENSFAKIKDFSLLYPGGTNEIKRFCLLISKDEFIEHLRKTYPGHAIVWIE